MGDRIVRFSVIRCIWITCFLLFTGCSQSSTSSQNTEPVPIDFISVLEHAANLDALVYEPLLGTGGLFSSAMRPDAESLLGYAEKRFGDWDHGSFLEVKEVPGGVEATLAEIDGAGVVTWIFSANPNGTLVLEVDGNRIEQSFKSFLLGKWLPVKEPFSARTAGGYNLHFPLVHKSHCRIAVRAETRAQLAELFYAVAWNRLDTNRPVEHFELAAVKKSQNELKEIARTFSANHVISDSPVWSDTIFSGEKAEVVSVSGKGIIRGICIEAETKTRLADLRVEIYWDGETEPAVCCPLHMLCGVSGRFEDVQSRPVTVSGNRAILRWPMPYSNGAKICIVNGGADTANISVKAEIDPSGFSNRRFTSAYSEHRQLPLQTMNEVILADVAGTGAIVGCILDVTSDSEAWWGEGDPVIWLDQSDQPVWRGTGTEDYFGFAWCSRDIFQHPLRGQTCAAQNGATLYRYHLLDTLPFSQRSRFLFEVCGSGSGKLDYSALILFYSENHGTEP